MINQPAAGTTPSHQPITSATRDRPGIFLDPEGAERQLAEYPPEIRDRYRVVAREIRALGWRLVVWVAVPTEGTSAAFFDLLDPHKPMI